MVSKEEEEEAACTRLRSDRGPAVLSRSFEAIIEEEEPSPLRPWPYPCVAEAFQQEQQDVDVVETDDSVSFQPLSDSIDTWSSKAGGDRTAATAAEWPR